MWEGRAGRSQQYAHPRGPGHHGGHGPLQWRAGDPGFALAPGPYSPSCPPYAQFSRLQLPRSYLHPWGHSVCTGGSLCPDHSSSSALGCSCSLFRFQLKLREAFQKFIFWKIFSQVDPPYTQFSNLLSPITFVIFFISLISICNHIIQVSSFG